MGDVRVGAMGVKGGVAPWPRHARLVSCSKNKRYALSWWVCPQTLSATFLQKCRVALLQRAASVCLFLRRSIVRELVRRPRAGYRRASKGVQVPRQIDRTARVKRYSWLATRRLWNIEQPPWERNRPKWGLNASEGIYGFHRAESFVSVSTLREVRTCYRSRSESSEREISEVKPEHFDENLAYHFT